MVGALKLAMVGILVPWKSADAVHQDFDSPIRELVYQKQCCLKMRRTVYHSFLEKNEEDMLICSPLFRE